MKSRSNIRKKVIKDAAQEQQDSRLLKEKQEQILAEMRDKRKRK